MSKRWADLSRRTRIVIVAGAIAEAILKMAMLDDLKRRPQSEIRGAKRIWAISAAVNTAGLGSIAYFAFGRRRPSSS